MADRHAFANRVAAEWGTPAKVLISAGFAGVLGLLSQFSVPVPWTPVPLTLQMFGVLLVGTCLGPRFGLLSIAMYLAAGALGLHVFAPSADPFNSGGLVSGERWRVLVPDLARHTGFTAGYLIGFLPATLFVGAYLRRRAAGTEAAWARRTAITLFLLLVGASAAAFFLAKGNTFAGTGAGPAYSGTMDALWAFLAAAAVAVPGVAWWLLRRRGGSEALDLFVVLLAATAIVHLCGVLVLAPTLGLTWTKAVALGSTVFLPFDALKAGLAVSLTLPFLPSWHGHPPETTA
ncbi:MAG: biotin transport system substrate-specific component [Thermoplasmata archaeon]|nr:biotin transport system substrate-specific component [Thermoplasmata archaeon]